MSINNIIITAYEVKVEHCCLAAELNLVLSCSSSITYLWPPHRVTMNQEMDALALDISQRLNDERR